MKYLIIFAFTALSSITIFGQNTDAISKYFEQYVENDDFTVVYVSAKMFEILGKLDLEGFEDAEAEIAMEMVSKLEGVRVLTTEKDPMGYYKNALKTIDVKEYESLVQVRDEGENVNLMIKDLQGDIINEMLVLVGGEDEFVLVSIIGEIDLKNISKLSKAVNIKGMEHLDKADKKQ